MAGGREVGWEAMFLSLTSGSSPPQVAPSTSSLNQFWGHQSLKISSSWSRSVRVRAVWVSGTGPRTARCCIRGGLR